METDRKLEQQLGPTLGPLVQALGDYICRRMQQGANDDWVSQHGSLLGNRRHCAIVRRLAEQGDPRAIIDGKRFLLHRDAVTEQLHRLGVRPPLAKAASDDPPDEQDEEQDAYTRVMAKVRGVQR